MKPNKYVKISYVVRIHTTIDFFEKLFSQVIVENKIILGLGMYEA